MKHVLSEMQLEYLALQTVRTYIFLSFTATAAIVVVLACYRLTKTLSGQTFLDRRKIDPMVIKGVTLFALALLSIIAWHNLDYLLIVHMAPYHALR